MARHGQRLLKLLDDTPTVPGTERPAYDGASQARQILNDAEDDLRDWRPEPDDGDELNSDRQGARSRDSRNASKGGRNYDPANDYEGGSQSYDFVADNDKDAGQDAARGAQSTSSQMMSGGLMPAEVGDHGVETGEGTAGGDDVDRGVAVTRDE